MQASGNECTSTGSLVANCYVNRTSFRLSLPAIGLVAPRKLFPNNILPLTLPSIQIWMNGPAYRFTHSLVEHVVFHRRSTTNRSHNPAIGSGASCLPAQSLQSRKPISSPLYPLPR
jgi:hypothetical protein